VLEFKFGWSGERKLWTGWELVATTQMVASVLFARIHAFDRECKKLAWI
jgi:hypothetical protein